MSKIYTESFIRIVRRIYIYLIIFSWNQSYKKLQRNCVFKYKQMKMLAKTNQFTLLCFYNLHIFLILVIPSVLPHKRSMVGYSLLFNQMLRILETGYLAYYKIKEWDKWNELIGTVFIDNIIFFLFLYH